MNWIIAVTVLLVIGFLLDREIYFYEGAHLGPRWQAWLYDRWSKKYDAGKRSSQEHDDEMLARPLLESLKSLPEPFILDFATGTGRLAVALLKRPEFTGHIVAVDLSRGMLEQAAAKLHAHPGRADFLRQPTLPLPFRDGVFDAVCALEVLELFPDMQEPLHELARVLRPGGVLLTSRGTEESGRKAKVKSRQEIKALLEKNGLEKVRITTWWKLFDRVLAVRSSSSQSAGARNLLDVLQCSSCSAVDWTKAAGHMKCQNCGNTLPITENGIVLNHR